MRENAAFPVAVSFASTAELTELGVEAVINVGEWLLTLFERVIIAMTVETAVFVIQKFLMTSFGGCQLRP